MIAAIPAEDRPTIIAQEIPAHLAPKKRAAYWDDPLAWYDAPRVCLSCGAKTNTAGELPCGH
ncbi:hypothetical protein ACIPEN_22160 [Herbaspirillum chlorophenolicum]|uniref:Transposase n=1 Tax=Herbaspirillum chlorophenolicum TaxID=211589 RepID=A0ABW8F5H7_9BURK